MAQQESDDASEGLFAMTALPQGASDSVKSSPRALATTTDSSDLSDKAKNNDEADGDDFFGDIGYNALVRDYNGACMDDSDLAEEFAKLQTRVEQCRRLRRTVHDLKADLGHAQKQTAAASLDDANKQRESDERMERIRKMEEDAIRIQDSVPTYEERCKSIECEKEELTRKINAGPGWTEGQNRERSSLVESIDRSRSEVAAKNGHLSDLRSQLEIAEKEAEASIKRRDQSMATIDALSAKNDNTQEQVLAIMQRVNEARRSTGVLVETKRMANEELTDLKAECDREKQMAEDAEQEVNNLHSAQKQCFKEHAEQTKLEETTLEELSRVLVENAEIDGGNKEKQKELLVISKERDNILNERAKASQLRKLIETKAKAADKERGALQEEADSLTIRTTKLENTDIPLARRETEVLKRDIKRQEHELGLIGRKIGLSQKAAERINDIIKSNENSLKSQLTELSGIKRTIVELQKARDSIVPDENRDGERLKRSLDVLQVNV